MSYEKEYRNKDKLYFLHTRAELLQFVPPQLKSALDIGCGTGAFGASLKHKFNCTVWGVEPNCEAALEASKNIDVSINNIFSPDLPELKNHKFDAIFFNDVLEHLANPQEALMNCKQLLAKDGCIIASIPNIRWYPVILSLVRYKDFKYENAGVMDKTHLRFFTLKSMKRLFRESGYTVIRAEGINRCDDFKYFNIINKLLLNSQWDMKYPQFAIVAV